MPSTLEVMREVLARRFGIDDPQLGADRELASLGLDSLGFIEYTFELENELHVVLPDVPRDLVTIGDFARFVEAEVSRQASAAPAT
jgi:acyl carrier protein